MPAGWHAQARPLELKSTFDGSVTLTCTHGVLDQPGRMLRQFALYGVDPGLGALLVLGTTPQTTHSRLLIDQL
jgi:hypothetical protein